MIRRDFLKTLGISTALLTGHHLFSQANNKQHPNVILCMCDDLGWGDVAYNGNKIIQTPNLDKMAGNSIRFDRFYAAAPVCSPTRGGAITGRHPHRYGVFYANTGKMRAEEFTLAEALKTKGYATGHFGKWHLGTLTKTIKDANRGGKQNNKNEFSPPWINGFETCFSTESKTPTWDPMKLPSKLKKDESKKYGWRALKDGEKFQAYGTHYWNEKGEIIKDNLKGDDSKIIIDRAIPFIKKSVQDNKPFFAVIWFHTPHLPVVAGPKYAEMYKKQTFKMQQYAGCITAMDEQIGRLRQALKDTGVTDNTMLCFTSDNGPENGTPGSTGGFRGRKRSLYEGGIRVPGLLEWPKMIKKGRVVNTPCVTTDYFPTVMEIVGFKIPNKPRPIDGVSLLPIIKNKQEKRPTPIAFVSKKIAVLSGNQYKLYTKKQGDKKELYDLLKDPYEKNNIAKNHPKIVKEMSDELTKWLKSCKGSFEGNDYDKEEYQPDQKWSYHIKS